MGFQKKKHSFSFGSLQMIDGTKLPTPLIFVHPRTKILGYKKSKFPAHLIICLLEESFSEDSHNKNVDDEWSQKSDRWFNEVVKVGFLGENKYTFSFIGNSVA